MLERTLGLQIDLSGFYEMASDDPKIGGWSGALLDFDRHASPPSLKRW